MTAELSTLTIGSGDAMLTKQTDVDLISAVASRRDAAAFAELFRRYKRQAFNLAYYISRNKETAEEAVQDGMLRIWSKADTFKIQETDKVKSWIMCIVARSAQLSCRRRRREQEIIDKQAGDSTAPPPSLPQEASDRKELLEAMRRELDHLPMEDRVLMSLYFGAGMSQFQISQNLSMPQTTVSFRVKKILEHLRGKLSSAGLASAATLLTTEWISEALCQHLAEPQGFEERILSRVQRAPASASVIFGTRSMPFLIASGILAAVAVVFSTHYLNNNTGIQEIDAKPSREQATEVPNTDSSTAGEPLEMKWDFSKGPCDDLQLEAGGWEWQQSRKGDGAMVIPKGKNALIGLPSNLCYDYWIINIRISPAEQSDEIFTGAFWRTEFGYERFKSWNRKVISNKKLGTVTTYGMGSYCATYFDHKFQTLKYYDKKLTRKTLGIHLSNVRVRWISFSALAPDELPQELQNPETLPKRFGLILRKDF